MPFPYTQPVARSNELRVLPKTKRSPLLPPWSNFLSECCKGAFKLKLPCNPVVLSCSGDFLRKEIQEEKWEFQGLIMKELIHAVWHIRLDEQFAYKVKPLHWVRTCWTPSPPTSRNWWMPGTLPILSTSSRKTIPTVRENGLKEDSTP